MGNIGPARVRLSFLLLGPTATAAPIVDGRARTFVEQVPGLTEPHARRSSGLRQRCLAVGLALAGRAGYR